MASDCLHVVQVGDLALFVGNNGECDFPASHLIDILNPSLVAAERVGGQADQLNATLSKLGLQLSKGAELGSADGGVVFGVREENDPVAANKLVEIDGAVGGISLEVGGDGSEA